MANYSLVFITKRKTWVIMHFCSYDLNSDPFLLVVTNKKRTSNPVGSPFVGYDQ